MSVANRYVDDVVRIPSTMDTFFDYWVEVLKPFHKLTNRECQILAAFLKKRFELSLKISDDGIINKMLMSDDVKAEIREITNLSIQGMYPVLRAFEENKVTINGEINKRFIPKMTKDKGSYRLMFFFEVDNVS